MKLEIATLYEENSPSKDVRSIYAEKAPIDECTKNDVRFGKGDFG